MIKGLLQIPQLPNSVSADNKVLGNFIDSSLAIADARQKKPLPQQALLDMMTQEQHSEAPFTLPIVATDAPTEPSFSIPMTEFSVPDEPLETPQIEENTHQQSMALSPPLFNHSNLLATDQAIDMTAATGSGLSQVEQPKHAAAFVIDLISEKMPVKEVIGTTPTNAAFFNAEQLSEPELSVAHKATPQVMPETTLKASIAASDMTGPALLPTRAQPAEIRPTLIDAPTATVVLQESEQLGTGAVAASQSTGQLSGLTNMPLSKHQAELQIAYQAPSKAAFELPVTESLPRTSAPLYSTIEQPSNVQQWRTETLANNPSEWGQRLLHVLSDKVNLQIGQQVQRAQIRLDPPSLGSIDIAISVDGEKTSVQIIASNAQVREAMQQTLEQLRQSLISSQGGAVDVDVSDKQRGNSQSENYFEEQDVAQNLRADGVELEAEQALQHDWLNRLI